MVYNQKIITSEPLVGPDAVTPGLRIVVWDHFNAQVVFVGRIIHVRDGIEAIGDNFAHGLTDGTLQKRTHLDLVKCGVLPVKDMRGQFSLQFRSYRLPPDLDPLQHGSFKVAYKVPDQKQLLKRDPAIKGRPPIQVNLVEFK